jgi:hypothetical protein
MSTHQRTNAPLIYVWSTDVGEYGRDLLGFVESIGEHQWHAVGSRRAPHRWWMYDLGFYSAPTQARAAIRINALIPGEEN